MIRKLNRAIDRVRVREVLGWLGRQTLGRLVDPGLRARWLRYVPLRARKRSAWSVWPSRGFAVPERLRTVPGIWRDPEQEARASETPQYSFMVLHSDSAPTFRRYGWTYWLPSLPVMHRMGSTIRQLIAQQPASPPPTAIDPVALTAELRAEARRLGLSDVGFAPFDANYTFAEARVSGTETGSPTSVDRAAAPDEGSVIVCVLEQDWQVTQTIPTARAEREVMRTYGELVQRAAGLARLLHERGFRADVQGPGGSIVAIHYAVQAGLGQLGLNGQLLTPQAGSRCRITVITTNATLVHDSPADFGIHAICDECQVCVRRCPSGAIPKTRAYHRGILKAKIKPERCFPILTRAHGCGICMKTCPIQRFGLEAVTVHLIETGEILGKGTDELEGYHWIDGQFYGSGQKPRISESTLHPAGMVIDAARTAPPPA